MDPDSLQKEAVSILYSPFLIKSILAELVYVTIFCLASPDPGAYDQKSTMDQSHPLHKHVRATQWSKGCSRDAFASQLNPGKFIKIRGVSPGPGQY